MARYPIVGLEAQSFGPLESVNLSLSSTLNVITGANATGKSQLLKLLYACTRALSEPTAPTKTVLTSSLAEGLVGVFRPDQLGRLVRRTRGRGRASVTVRYQDVTEPLSFAFASNARTEVHVESLPQARFTDTPVFFPSRELLSLYPGLVSLFETREVEFDETWRDTALLLGRTALRGPRGDLANELLEPVLAEIEGAVAEENGRFYVRLRNGNAGTDKIEAHLVSEGYRKLAMIIRLVSNGVLLQGGYLFWDEPEANLNPATLRSVARAILALARSGTQVFVATHSIFLLREFELLLMEQAEGAEIHPQYIGLFREASDEEGLSGTVRAESATDPADLSSIAALDAESAQSLRYLES